MVELIILGAVLILCSIIISVFMSAAVYKACTLQQEGILNKVSNATMLIEEMMKNRFDIIGTFLVGQLPSDGEAAYSFVVKNTKSAEEKLLITRAQNEAEAADKVAALLELQGLKVEEWAVRGQTSIAIKKMNEDVKPPIEAPTQYVEKKVDVYVKDLLYAADNFATTKAEKSAILSIVRKIKSDGKS